MTSQPPSNPDSRQIAVRSESTDYYLVLSRLIETTKDDPAQLRALVYELARVKLRRETWVTDPPMSRTEAKEHLWALEDAIDRMEELNSQDGPHAIPYHGASEETRISPEPFVQIIEPPRNASRTDEILHAVSDLASRLPKSRETWWPTRIHALLFVGVGLLVIAVGFGLAEQFSSKQQAPLPKTDRVVVAAEIPPEPKPAAVPRAPAMPLPTTYGVYALSQGALYQLEALPTRIPDERVLIGPVFSKPSPVTLPDGKVSFVIFRRDLVNAAPERISVRVVARIGRELKFQAGQAVTNSETSWTIRGKSFEFRVAPIGEDQQMILVKPENEDFALPAGRYALALKGGAYDFTIDGKITDPAQCLERVEAVNGTVYTACANP